MKKTAYINLDRDAAEDLDGGADLFPEDIVDPWHKVDGYIYPPKGMIPCFLDEMAAKSDQDIARAIINEILATVQVNVPEERIREWHNQKPPDPSSALLTMGVRAEDVVSIHYP
tara:strand:- start:15237 stop:15578 length:342 start_codon:yes stop_codon:yes gene_type:complete